MANSLGSLYIDIQARTATLESDMDKVKKVLNQTRDATNQAGEAAKSAFKSFQLFNSFQGRGMTGISLDMFAFFSLIQAVKKELTYVVENIEKIPGIPAEAVTNVQEFRTNLAAARATIDSFIAQGISGFTQFAKAAGAGLASLFYGSDALDDSLKAELESLDKIKASLDPAYYDKVRQAVQQLSDAKKKDVLAEMSNADKITELRQQAAQYNTYAKSNSIDTLQRLQAQTKAVNDLTQADKLHMEIQKLYDANVRKYYADETKDLFVLMSQKDKMAELDKLIGEAMTKSGMMRPTVVGGSLGELTDEQMEKANKMFPQLLGWMNMYRSELAKLRTASMEWRDMTVALAGDLNNFLTSFVTGGKITINSFLKSISDAIIQTFFKLALINPLLNSLFGSSKGFSLLPTLFGGGAAPAKADGGPGRGLTLVGERGPELLNLGSGSTIIPNYGMRGSGGGMTVYMDARGADESRIQAMERNLAYLHATFERRVIGTIAGGKDRRGSLGAALA